MKPAWRISIAAAAAALAFAPVPAAAQVVPPPAPATNQSGQPAQPADLIGPPQLKSFSLDGKVTRQSEEPVALKAKPAQQGSAQPSASTPPQAAPQRTASTPEPAERQPATQQPQRRETAASVQPEQTTAPQRTSSPAPQVAEQAAPVSSSDRTQSAFAAASSAIAPDPVPVPASLDAQQSRLPLLPWLLAILVLGAGAAWFFLRQRQGPRLATAGASLPFDIAGSQAAPPAPPRPKPAAAPAAAPRPASAPAPAPTAAPKPVGIVSTRLRPWIELEFTPERAVLDNDRMVIEFAVSMFNSGSAPARDLLVEAALFNAGAYQDQQIQAFFDKPVAKGDRIPMLAPLQRFAIRSAVTLPRAQVMPIEMEGRPLLVPLIAFNALYRSTSSEGQTSASYLVGKATDGEKLAPFRLDQPPRIFRRLAAREHQLRVRK